MFCNFIPISETAFKCSVCGNSITIMDEFDDPPLFPCQSSLVRKTDSVFLDSVKSFDDSVNRSLCNDLEILHRHNICLGCPELKGDSCSQCGCAITRNKEFANKLLWKDEKCPLDKWS